MPRVGGQGGCSSYLVGERGSRNPSIDYLISQAQNNIPTLHMLISVLMGFISNVVILFNRWGKIRITVFLPTPQTPQSSEVALVVFLGRPLPLIKYNLRKVGKCNGRTGWNSDM